LWNLAPRIPVEHRFSLIFEGQPELIDHILISHALLAGLVSVDADVTGLASIGTTPRPPGRVRVRSRPTDRALHLTCC
jgi:hypothetical protein